MTQVSDLAPGPLVFVKEHLMVYTISHDITEVVRPPTPPKKKEVSQYFKNP
jgi:hypothetical protein